MVLWKLGRLPRIFGGLVIDVGGKVITPGMLASRQGIPGVILTCWCTHPISLENKRNAGSAGRKGTLLPHLKVHSKRRLLWRNLGRQCKAHHVQTPQETDDSQDEFSLFMLGTHMAPSLMLMVDVDGVPLNMELDIGVAVSIVSRCTCMERELEQAA